VIGLGFEIAMEHYSARIEQRMKRFFQTLAEKDRRRYAAVEADKLGYGGTEYITTLFALDPKTIRQGMADLDEPEDPAGGRIRKKGVGASG
jgi:hypothetical protein